MKNMLKTREQILASIKGSVNESTFKIGDIFKVKPIVDVPKSLINAFVSKAKKEQDVDPRENWSDTDLAELMVNYIVSTFMNVDSIPVEAIMGDKKPAASIQVQEPAQAIVQPAQTSQPVQAAQEETKIANIPAQLQVEGKTNENLGYVTFEFNKSETNPGYLNDMLTLYDATKIANELGLNKEEPSEGVDTTTQGSFSNEDETILIETQYGISFDIENKDLVKDTLIKLGYTVNESEDNEPIESFMVNTELTDTIKEHLKENKISFEKTSGILEIKATKSQLETLKKLF